MRTIKLLPRLLWVSLRRFIRDEAMNHAAALSYYTVFALPPILIILISLVGYFWSESAFEQRIFSELSALIGEGSAGQVRLMLNKVKADGSNTATAVGIVTLLFSSTVVFYTIQHSLNRLWRIQDEIRHGFVKYVIDKVLSLAFILSFGFLLAVSLILQAFISWMNRYFSSTVQSAVQDIGDDPTLFEQAMQFLHYLYAEYFSSGFFVLEFLIAFSLNSFLFACIFKFLPDARVKWKVALPGGMLTALLFQAGQGVIGWKLAHTDFSNTYGPAGAIIVVFVWIFYSSTIIFYGGIFTQLYGNKTGNPIRAIPGHHGDGHGHKDELLDI